MNMITERSVLEQRSTMSPQDLDIFYLHEKTQGLPDATSGTQDGHLSLRSGRATVRPLGRRQRLLG